MNKSKDQKSDLKKAEAKSDQRRLIKFYLLPAFSILSFILIIIGIVLPKVSEIFTTLDNITTLSEQFDQNQVKIESLNLLNSSTNLLLAQLKVIDETAPTGRTEVVTFRDKITQLSRDNNLSVLTQSLSESDINQNAQNINTIGLGLLEIPFLFEIDGSYSNMLNFIEDLSQIEDFIIVREMELSSSNVNNIQTTNLQLRVDKYQFNIINEELLVNQYVQVPIESEINKVVLNYIESKLRNNTVID